MRPLRLFTGTVLLVILLCPYGPSQEEKPGKVLLKKTDEAYKSLQSYQDKTTSIMNVSAQGMEQKMKAELSIAMKRPNKLAVVLKSGMMGMTIVCNGEKMWTYMPMFKKYTVENAPESLEELIESASMMGMAGRSIIIITLFGDNPYEMLMEGVERVKLVGEEIVEGTKMHHIILYQEEMDIDLWIDAGDYLIRKVRMDMSKIMEKQKEIMPGLADMKMILEELHSDVRIAEDIPDTRFIFKAPEGARETDDLFGGFGPPAEPSPLVGKETEDFTLEGFEEGVLIHPMDHKGKVIMLDFWATWCGPCRKDLPVLQRIYEKYKDKEFVFIAVNAMEDREKVEEFIKKGNHTFPVALDKDGKVGELYKVEAYPTLILIGKDGKIQKVHTGYMPGLKKRLEKDLNLLLAGGSLAGKE
ncbi:MAG TPA: DUF2092 domain-containing protein [Candidatus Korarchaeota archaeon]|nr:DUF2092 domain-containing protein [Candidatus Korarchaeota archaeon]